MDILEIFIKWAIPFGCAIIFSLVTEYARKKSSRERAIEEGVKSLLRAEIIRQYEKYTEQGCCPIYAREPLKKVYNAYHGLNGNGTGTEMYKKTIALPVKAGFKKGSAQNT